MDKSQRAHNLHFSVLDSMSDADRGVPGAREHSIRLAWALYWSLVELAGAGVHETGARCPTCKDQPHPHGGPECPDCGRN